MHFRKNIAISLCCIICFSLTTKANETDVSVPNTEPLNAKSAMEELQKKGAFENIILIESASVLTNAYISKDDFIATLENLEVPENLTEPFKKSLRGQSISRQESISILGKIFKLESEKPLEFKDKDKVFADYVKYISAFCEKGIITESENFRPTEFLTWGELSVILNLISENGIIEKISPTTNNVLNVYAGTSQIGRQNGDIKEATFTIPLGIAKLPSGELIVADSVSNMLRSIGNNQVDTFAGTVIGTNITGLPVGGHLDNVEAKFAVMDSPKYIAVSTEGDVYYTESNKNTVRVIRKNDGKSYTFAGNIDSGYSNGSSAAATFSTPSGIAIDKQGNVYVADTLNHCIRKIDTSNVVTLYAGNPDINDGGYKDASDKLDAEFNEPTDIFWGEDSSLYVADTGNSLIRKINENGVTTVAGKITTKDENSIRQGGFLDGLAKDSLFKYPRGIYVTPNGDIYVADTGNNLIRKISKGKVRTIAGDGNSFNSVGLALQASLNQPFDIVYDNNKLYISDSLNNCIKVLYFSGESE